MDRPDSPRIWTVAEAKARLSEILRLAETEGPQRIGIRNPCVVVPAEAWDAKSRQCKPLGQWLVENTPRGVNLEVPRDRASKREIPFVQGDSE